MYNRNRIIRNAETQKKQRIERDGWIEKRQIIYDRKFFVFHFKLQFIFFLLINQLNENRIVITTKKKKTQKKKQKHEFEIKTHWLIEFTLHKPDELDVLH